MNSWENNWRDFVVEVAARFDRGDSDKELSQEFGGEKIRWIGVVRELRLDAEYSRGVALDMPQVVCRVRGDYRLIASYVFAGTSDGTSSSWNGVKIGDEVCFESTLMAEDFVFTGISVPVFDDDKQCSLELALFDSCLSEIIREG